MISCEPVFYYHVLYTHKNYKFILTFGSVDESSINEEKTKCKFAIVPFFKIFPFFPVGAYIFKIMGSK